MSNQQSASWMPPFDDDKEVEVEQFMTDSYIGEGVPETNVDVEGEDVEAENEIVGNKRKQRSVVWNHFKRKVIVGKQKAICMYCEGKLTGDPRQGTTHLRNHLMSCKEAKRVLGSNLSLLLLEKKRKGTDSHVLNQELCRHALAKMIIAHEYPLAVVDHLFFREFCYTLHPDFKAISRNTIKKDIMKIFNDEKEKTMKLLSKNQSIIAITSDMWTANYQNRGYMAVTAHFVDDSWVLQSRLVRFIYVPAPHSGEVLSDVLVKCLLDWNLDGKVSTVTLDNCSANDKMIDFILDKISPRKLILGGRLLHMRCCAHILNLVVKDGLDIISDAIENVRDSVAFWTATGKREEKFESTCEQLNISYSRRLVGDCITRWNSTFLMLRVACEYKEVFSRLSQRVKEYKTKPSEEEWEMTKAICQKLELFFEVTKLFYGTSYPTANVLFPKICEIKNALGVWHDSTNEIIHEMAKSMIEKFEKYWGVINVVMVVGSLLDPRLKLNFIKIYFPFIYGEEASHEVERIKETCQELIKEYGKKLKGKEAMSQSPQTNPDGEQQNIGGIVSWKTIYKNHPSAQSGSSKANYKSQLNTYLEEGVLPLEDHFDILGWLKLNGSKYPILQMVARDFLAIPVPTVASESAFSTGGRFLTPHRSRLLPDTLEAMICSQNWLWSNVKGSSQSQSMDKIKKFEYCTTMMEDFDEESCGGIGVDNVDITDD